MALKALLCSSDDESPQYRSVLRAIHTLNSPKNYLQIRRSPNTSYAKCRMGLRERKMEMAGNGFSSCPIFVS